MIKNGAYARCLIWISLIPAFILALVPLPSEISYARPAWLALSVLFWLIYTPNFAGLLTAWCAGLLLDVLTGVLLGQNALAMLIMSMVASWFHRRLDRASRVEQLLYIIPLILIFQLIYLWVGIALGQINPTFYYLLPVATSVIFWPVVVFFLGKLRFIYNV